MLKFKKLNKVLGLFLVGNLDEQARVRSVIKSRHGTEN